MSQRWYGPEKRWPAHPKDWFRDALEVARARGWWLMKFDGYGYGAVYCAREGEVDGDPCTFVIFKTASAGEDGAKDLRKLVAKCPHRPPEEPTGVQARLAEADAALTGAERLLAAVRLLRKGGASRERSDELLVEALKAIDGAETLTLAVQAEAEAESAEAEAAVVLADELGEEAGAAEALEGAEERIASAERGLDRVRNRPEKRILLARAASLRDEAQALREL